MGKLAKNGSKCAIHTFTAKVAFCINRKRNAKVSRIYFADSKRDSYTPIPSSFSKLIRHPVKLVARVAGTMCSTKPNNPKPLEESDEELCRQPAVALARPSHGFALGNRATPARQRDCYCVGSAAPAIGTAGRCRPRPAVPAERQDAEEEDKKDLERVHAQSGR